MDYWIPMEKGRVGEEAWAHYYGHARASRSHLSSSSLHINSFYQTHCAFGVDKDYGLWALTLNN